MSEKTNFDEVVPPFDPRTMAGIRPGAHTKQYHHLRTATTTGTRVNAWISLAWQQEPDMVVAVDHAPNQPPSDNISGPPPRHEPLFKLSTISGHHLFRSLLSALDNAQRVAHVCGTCRFWRMTHDSTPDLIPAGRCQWQEPDPTDLPHPDTSASAMTVGSATVPVVLQSCLATPCAAYRVNDQPTAHPADPVLAASQSKCTGDPGDSGQSRSMLQSIRAWFRNRISSPQPEPQRAAHIVEASGVGAGTEPCPVCHGRIANLGSTTDRTPDGDQNTVSVWRCRNCYTLYLNNWIDRWSRLASLETEEIIYRIPPDHAVTMLALMRPELIGLSHRAKQVNVDNRAAIVDLMHRSPVIWRQKKQGR